MKIILSGGGTLGPVTPLLAIAETIKEAHPDAEFFWIGTKDGPERALVERAGIAFSYLPGGKFRRYASLRNITDIWHVAAGFFAAYRYLRSERPSVCISAGGFVSVPVHGAAWLLKIPTWIHQQDVEVGLANRMMGWIATSVTTSLEAHYEKFKKQKTRWIGNPVREEIFHGDAARVREKFGVDAALPVVFVMGGGTGSLRVNQLITEALPHLEGICHVIHLSGRERPQELIRQAANFCPWYHPMQFTDEGMPDLYAAGDVIVSRGGFGSLSEIAALGKPAIIIPKPGHQERNVSWLADAGAVIVLDEKMSHGTLLAKTIKDLLIDTKKREDLSRELKRLLPPAEKEDILAVFRMLVQ